MNTLSSLLDFIGDRIKDGTIYLDTTAATGTVDGDLYAAITALSWESDVID